MNKRAVGTVIGLGIAAFLAFCTYNSLRALRQAIKEKEEREAQKIAQPQDEAQKIAQPQDEAQEDELPEA